MNRTETLAELKRLRDTGGTVGPWLLRDAIAAIEDAEQDVDTYNRASSYWYVKCQMDRGHTVDPYSSSQHNDEIVRQMVAERQRVAELEREVVRLSSMDGAVATLKAVVRGKTPGKCRLLSEGERCDCHLCRLDWIQFTLSGK